MLEAAHAQHHPAPHIPACTDVATDGTPSTALVRWVRPTCSATFSLTTCDRAFRHAQGCNWALSQHHPPPHNNIATSLRAPACQHQPQVRCTYAQDSKSSPLVTHTISALLASSNVIPPHCRSPVDADNAPAAQPSRKASKRRVAGRRKLTAVRL